MKAMVLALLLSAADDAPPRFQVKQRGEAAWVVVDSKTGGTVSGSYAEEKEAGKDANLRNLSETKGSRPSKLQAGGGPPKK